MWEKNEKARENPLETAIESDGNSKDKLEDDVVPYAPIHEIKVDKREENDINLEDFRIKIGKAENSNRDIYWEYGNAGLAK